ncbi:addiction module protein [Salinisphaera sp.]|uniref:addiction module protein n=1 Tax=Salinisphaera sp. TaxID=1914330 RepID=UPI0025E8AA89|nr:addiction module protein [Salinisphaera sp.]
MTNLSELEKQALELPPQERERLVLTMWDSLEGMPAVDPEGVEIARCRDAEVEAGAVQLISHSEFQRRTSGG